MSVLILVVWKHFLSTDNLEKFYFIDYDTDDGRKIEMGPSNTIHIVFGFSPLYVIDPEFIGVDFSLSVRTLLAFSI